MQGVVVGNQSAEDCGYNNMFVTVSLSAHCMKISISGSKLSLSQLEAGYDTVPTVGMAASGPFNRLRCAEQRVMMALWRGV